MDFPDIFLPVPFVFDFFLPLLRFWNREKRKENKRKKEQGGREISVRIDSWGEKKEKKKVERKGLLNLLRGTSGSTFVAYRNWLYAVEELYRYFGGVCNEFPSSSASPWHLVNCQSSNRNFASIFIFRLVFLSFRCYILENSCRSF